MATVTDQTISSVLTDLAILGPDGIANAIRSALPGKKFDRTRPTTCAVAEYLKHALNVEYVSVGVTGATIIEALGGLAYHRVLLPSEVAEFIRRFDTGNYPDLYREADERELVAA